MTHAARFSEDDTPKSCICEDQILTRRLWCRLAAASGCQRSSIEDSRSAKSPVSRTYGAGLRPRRNDRRSSRRSTVSHQEPPQNIETQMTDFTQMSLNGNRYRVTHTPNSRGGIGVIHIVSVHGPETLTVAAIRMLDTGVSQIAIREVQPSWGLSPGSDKSGFRAASDDSPRDVKTALFGHSGDLHAAILPLRTPAAQASCVPRESASEHSDWR